MRKGETVYYVSVLGKIDNSLSQTPLNKEDLININTSDIFNMISEKAFVFGCDEDEYFIRREYLETRRSGGNRFVLYKNNRIAKATECIEFLNYYFDIAELKEVE